jgi:YYY domain-containing protein
LKADLTPTQDPRGEGFTLQFDRPLPVQKDATYFLILSIGRETATLDVSGQVGLRLNTVGSAGAPGSADQRLPAPTRPIAPMPPYLQNFTPETDGDLQSIFLPTAAAPAANPSSGEPPLLLAVRLGIPGEQQLLINVALPAQPAPADDPRGPGYLLTIDPPVPLLAGQTYFLSIGLNAGNSAIALSGAAVANEGDWDDGLPLRLDGYDAMGGIYPQDVNFNMYTDDNPDKLAHFESIMNQADVIVISSSRQWGSLPRLPERFPMTTLYYRNLLGCPPEDSIEWCYNVAQPGTFQGNLGFKLDQVFESDPSIGPVRINDQFAEEAFTVYDHPKVFIFKKTSSYNPQRVQDILGVVDFSKVIRIPPLKAPAHPLNLMLPSDRWAQQMRGGTWSALFNTQDLQNRYQVVGVILWYLSVLLLGWFVYPLLRLAFPGLPDRGYPLARIAGLLILSYLVWLAGSFRIPFTRLTISVVIGLLAVVGGALAFLQRDELNLELRQRRKYFLAVEGLFLAFFLFDLLIRYGNPDLWHPFMGGEKPMDFSYFNAVLKSTTFPPYDPWFAGGYLNYYYYGFVLVGVLVKWLGIVPAFAYNLILPTIFSLIAMGAFSLAWNLYSSFWLQRKAAPAATGMEEGRVEPPPEGQPVSAYWAGLAGALGMAVLGNLGTVRMIFQGYEKLAAPGGAIENGGLLARWVWAIRGFFLTLAGHPLPYRLNEWYWNPSRAIPAPNEVEPITEFPFFTVLYADPHAHLFALPLTLLALSFALAVFLGHARWRNILGAGLGFLVGGLAIGVLRPTNTWDFPTYLALGVVAVGASILLSFPGESRLGGLPWLRDLPEPSRRLVAAAGGVLLLVVLAFVFFQPYAEWYGLGYTKVDLWKGTHTPISAYLTHWGLFLFVIVSWMAWETRQWMAQTPLSSLRKLQRYQFLIEVAGGLLLLILLGLLLLGARIAWLALPLAAWAGVLLLRPGLPDAKRFILFLVGTGLTLTLMVEVIVLRGDIARMNTVFKFYLQVWTLFAVSAAAALGWLLSALSGWLPGWRRPWQAVLVLLVVGTALYPLMGAMAKVKDRMAPQAPHTLDGMLYMKYATYDWQGQMNLDQDYNAIRWMQENVPGSPVIVEANLRDLYRWGSRYTIYTGLPGVVGWEWHEQQQRALIPSNWISDRINEIDTFYTTTDLNQAQEFLRKYDVQYIVVGQLERNHYPGPGLEKFQAANGVLWRQVYHQADTTIYQVEIDP